MAEPAEELAPGRVLLTRQEEGNLRYAYEMFDDDRSGDLSQGEIIKLLQRLSLEPWRFTAKRVWEGQAH